MSPASITARILLLGLSWGSLAAQTPPAAPAAPVITATTIVAVPAEATVLEEATLLMVPALASKLINSVVFGSPPAPGAPGDERAMSQDVTMSNDGVDQPNAFRLYGFTLEPGERLVLRLKAENSSKMWMKFMPPARITEMMGEIRAANRVAKPVRATRIALRNITKEKYKVVMQLYGEAGYKFHIDIERTRN